MANIVDQAKAQMAKSVESTKENFSGRGIYSRF